MQGHHAAHKVLGLQASNDQLISNIEKLQQQVVIDLLLSGEKAGVEHPPSVSAPSSPGVAGPSGRPCQRDTVSSRVAALMLQNAALAHEIKQLHSQVAGQIDYLTETASVFHHSRPFYLVDASPNSAHQLPHPLAATPAASSSTSSRWTPPAPVLTTPPPAVQPPGQKLSPGSAVVDVDSRKEAGPSPTAEEVNRLRLQVKQLMESDSELRTELAQTEIRLRTVGKQRRAPPTAVRPMLAEPAATHAEQVAEIRQMLTDGRGSGNRASHSGVCDRYDTLCQLLVDAKRSYDSIASKV